MDPCTLIVVYKFSESHPGVPDEEDERILHQNTEVFRNGVALAIRGRHLVIREASGDQWGIAQDEVSAYRWVSQASYDEEAAMHA